MLAALALALGGGPPELPAFFADHMVLQRATRAPLWGWVEPGEEVVVRASWEGARALSTRADDHGRFQVELETPAAGGPFTLAIAGTHGTRTLADVLVGEVWLASGQSNMEWTLGPRVGNGVEGWEEAARQAWDPFLRLFEVENAMAAAPARDVHGVWRAADPTSAASFSACAYFFARELRRELDVPVGVIDADWGGTPAEAWTSARDLASFPEFAEGLAYLARIPADPQAALAQRRAEQESYWRHALELDARLGLDTAMGAECDDSAWATVELPATFEQHGLERFDGLVWYRRAVELPGDWAGQELVLELGAIDDRDTVWWNGERVGGHEDDGQWQTPRRYPVPAALVRAGVNTLAVRVLDTGGLGGFASPAESLRVFRASAPETTLALAGTWRWKAGTPFTELPWPPSLELLNPGMPSVLWNAMVAPLVPAAARGVIWYQGEANRDRAAQYERLFPALIQSWRAAFRSPLAFDFVQIAPYGYEGDTGEAARLRDAQRKTLWLPDTGMAVTMDIGNPSDIHPLQKRQVGERLAGWALAKTYGRERECSGPLYRAVTVEDGALRVEFEHAKGLTSRGAAVRCVTLAGADRVFHPAEARIEGTTLRVSSPEVRAPVAVRFGWGAADLTNLWNGAGLPASSFRSDDWP